MMTIARFFILSMIALHLGCGSPSKGDSNEGVSQLSSSLPVPREATRSGSETKKEGEGAHSPSTHCFSEVRFQVDCQFRRQNPGQEFDHCIAKSAFRKKVTCLGGEVYDQSEVLDAPKLEIQCNDEVMTNVVGIRFTELLGTRIQPETRAYPALILPANSLTVYPHNLQGRLEFGCEAYSGSCNIMGKMN